MGTCYFETTGLWISADAWKLPLEKTTTLDSCPVRKISKESGVLLSSSSVSDSQDVFFEFWPKENKESLLCGKFVCWYLLVSVPYWESSEKVIIDTYLS